MRNARSNDLEVSFKFDFAAFFVDFSQIKKDIETGLSWKILIGVSEHFDASILS